MVNMVHHTPKCGTVGVDLFRLHGWEVTKLVLNARMIILLSHG